MFNLYNYSAVNKRKTWFLMTGFFIFIILVGYIFAQAMEAPGILPAAVIFSILLNFISYWYSDKIVLSMSGAKEVDKNNGRELYRLVENLCITAGLPLPKIYIIEDSAPNAFATGRDPQHAAIALTSGILGKLEKTELEGVIAHELSHIGNRDILISTIATVLVGIVVLLADWFRRWSFFGGRRSNDDNNNNQLGVIMLVLAIIFSILAPIFAQLLQLAVSRKREFAADADAALLTRYPEGLARALEKISADREPLEAANRATAHMYIVSPFKGKEEKNQVSWFAKMWMTHPPVAERIAKLRGN
ncbi:MAG: M48 family metallopeptidase [Patescibacteria group bacterium]|nr:M48 family metallopeptidase [Patescibacteria group bacterium]